MKLRRLVSAAVLGGGYAALTMLIAPLSYGPVQLRFAEGLCALCFFEPSLSWGLFVGCAAANLLSAAGPLDVVLGSLATLGSCLCMGAIGRRGRGMGRCALACLMPVLWNAVVVGAVLAVTTDGGGAFGPLFAVYALQVAAGESVVLFCLGLPLMRLLPKRRFFTDYLSHLKE